MTSPDFKYTIEEVDAARKSIFDQRYAEAFSHLRAAARPFPVLARDAENLEAKFFFMLRFLASDKEVGDLNAELLQTRDAIEILIRKIELECTAATGTNRLSAQLRYARMRPEENLASLISDYIAEYDRLSADSAALTDTRSRTTLERLASDIFNRLWTLFPFDSDTSDLLDSIIGDENIPYHDRALWVNALGLNYLVLGDDAIRQKLADIHSTAANEVSTIAGVWLVITAHSDATLDGNPDRSNTFGRLNELISAHPSDLKDTLFEWCRSLGTDSLSIDFKDMVSGRLSKLGRDFLRDLSESDPSAIDEKLMNSEWLSDKIDSSDFDAIRQFNDAQAKGDDVFMGTIGKMRNFEFFNNMANWFLPFHTAHSSLAPIVDGEGAAIADMIARMPMLCDGDKYALILSMAQAPPSMRDASISAMSAQLMSMQSNEEVQEMLGNAANFSRRTYINNVIKNIFRFFKSFTGRDEFRNPIATEPEVEMFAVLGPDTEEVVLEIADVLFAQKRYRYVSNLYRRFINMMTARPVTRQKAAFSAELSGVPSRAALLYRDILLQNPDDLWTAQRLAGILIASGQPDDAVKVLESFRTANTDNHAFLSLLAEAYCLANRWADAADIFHNIDFNLPEDDNSAKSDLAWVLTMAGDYDSADAIFESAERSVINLRRLSVLKWLMGHRREAISLREEARRLDGENDTRSTDALYKAGINYLTRHVTEATSLPMLNEILRYRRYGSDFGEILI